MCLQCLAEAEIVFENILQGYALMRATKDTDGWLAGQYGLVRINDPDFVWTGDPILNPWAHLSDEEIDAMSKDDIRFQDFNHYVNFIESIEPNFEIDPLSGYKLVQACIADGYDVSNPSRIVFWLINHIAEKLETGN